MDRPKVTISFLRMIAVIFCSLSGNSAQSGEKINQFPSPPPPASEGFLQYKNSPAQANDNYQFISKQENTNSNMDSNIKNYESGRSRAQQMVALLQNKELTKAFQKITNSGNKTLDENPEIKSPLGILAGAASFWYGRTLKLIKGENLNITAKMEIRSQKSEFSMSSPLMNGKLKFDASEGIGIGFNRSIEELQTEAVVEYNSKSQIISTELRKKIAPNLDLSFGASKIDQNTKIEYRINF